MLAGRKLTSIKKLISKAVIDPEISFEKSKTIVKEEKESVRMMKCSDELNEKEDEKNENNKIDREINEIAWSFFSTYIKMGSITTETCKTNDIEIMVDDNGIFWLNIKHIEEKLDRKIL